MTWRSSRHSENGGGCIEVADSSSGVTPVRDSKNPTGPALAFPASGWSSFLAAVQHGQLPAA